MTYYSPYMGERRVHAWELDSEGFYHCRICGTLQGGTLITASGLTYNDEILAVLREIRAELVLIRRDDHE